MQPTTLTPAKRRANETLDAPARTTQPPVQPATSSSSLSTASNRLALKRGREEDEQEAAQEEHEARVRAEDLHEPMQPPQDMEAFPALHAVSLEQTLPGGPPYRHETTGEVLDTDLVNKAKEVERANWTTFKVVEPVSDQEARDDKSGIIVRTRWLYTIKHDGSCKARLIATQVAYDHSTPGLFAATLTMPALKVLLWRSAALRWPVKTGDIQAAFLHAEVPAEDHIYLQPPPGEAPSGVMWRARKAAYGLRKAPRYFQDFLATSLESHGFRRCRADSMLFLHVETGSLLLIHADDTLLTAPEEHLEGLMTLLGTLFTFKPGEKLGEQWTTYLGRQWRRIPFGYEVAVQSGYIDAILSELDLTRCKAVQNPAWSPAEKQMSADDLLQGNDITMYRRCVGRLMRLVQERPDISYSAKEMARHMASPSYQDVAKLKRVASYLRGTTDLVL